MLFLLILLLSCACSLAADSFRPSQDLVPPPAAANEILNQTSREVSLRAGPVDLFPHAAAAATYDDNVLISYTRPISDVIWTVSPGLTLALGDVSASMPAPVTFDRLRTLLYYSLADQSSKPRRFIGVDYTPSINLYTDHDRYDNVDHALQLSGGYNFSRLVTELDFDFRQGEQKDSGLGDLVKVANYSGSVRNRYDLSERTSLDLNVDYLRYEYLDRRFQGYQNIRNTDWFNHRLGEKLTGGLGVSFGYLDPTINRGQTYEQALVRGTYRLTGKVDFNASAGAEWRQLGAGAGDTINPVFSVSGIFRPRETTTFTLEGHRNELASPYANYNYIQMGFSAGVRQLLFNRLYAGLRAGYDNIEYTRTVGSTASARADSFYYLQATADYDFNRHWTGSLFYNYHRDDSDVTIYNYQNNLVGARIMWAY